MGPLAPKGAAGGGSGGGIRTPVGRPWNPAIGQFLSTHLLHRLSAKMICSPLRAGRVPTGGPGTYKPVMRWHRRRTRITLPVPCFFACNTEPRFYPKWGSLRVLHD